MHRLLASLLTLPLLGATLHAAVAPPRPGPEELVRRLGDASYLVREDAAQLLLLLGPRARPALVEGTKSKDAEVKARSAELLPLLNISEQDRQVGRFLMTGETKGAVLPGWKAFGERAGTDLTARLLYADLYNHERDLLKAMEANPASLAGQFQTRLSKLQQSIRPFGNIIIIGGVVRQPKTDEKPARSSDLAALLLCAQPSSVTSPQFNQLNSLFYNAAAVQLVHGNAALRRLLSRHLEASFRDVNQLYSVAYVARNLRLEELNEKTIKPMLLREAEKALKPADVNKLMQVANVANTLDMVDALPAGVKTAARDFAAKMVGRPEDMARFWQVQSLLTSLRMQDALEEVVKPAVTKMARELVDRPLDYNRFNQVMSMAQTARADEALELLKPAACKLMVQAAAKPEDIGQFQQAVYLSMRLGLTAARETLLRPAARARVLAQLERPMDLNQLSQLNNLCQQLDLGKLAEQTVRPAVEKALPDIVATATNANQLTMAHNIAQQMGIANAIDKAIKPALEKLVSTGTLPANAWEIQPILQLANNLNVKKASKLALEAAKSNRVYGYLRGSSILFVGEHGTPEEVAQLEPLLKESTQVGAFSMNGQLLQTQVRDVVLAVLVSRSGQSIRDFGFSDAMNGGRIAFQTMPGSYGFPSQEARDKALARWERTPRKRS